MVFQYVQLPSKVEKHEGGDRHRCLLSDTVSRVQCLLTWRETPKPDASSWANLGHIELTVSNRGARWIEKKRNEGGQDRGPTAAIVVADPVLNYLGDIAPMGSPVPLEYNGAPTVTANPQNNMQQQQQQQQQGPQSIPSKGFYGERVEQKPQIKQESPRQAMPSRSGPPRTPHGYVTSIEGLSPYNNKWTVKARVTNKSDIMPFRNGDGQRFSCNLLDQSGEIKATVFGKQSDPNDLCRTMFDRMQEGSVYYIGSPCQVKEANRRYTNCNHAYELIFEAGTTCEKAEEADDIPQVQYKFATIQDLVNVEKDGTVDLIAILHDAGQVETILIKKTGDTRPKRELTLVDQSHYQVRLTLWGDDANNFSAQEGSVLAFKGARVNDFNGRSLSGAKNSMRKNPDIDESHALKGWYDADATNIQFIPIAQHDALKGGTMSGGGMMSSKYPEKTILAVKEERIGMNDQEDGFSLKASLLYINGMMKKEDSAAVQLLSYPACPKCNKKVVPENTTPEGLPSDFRCEACGQTYPEANHRYLLRMNLTDHSGQLWANCFDDVGKVIIGAEAGDVNRLNYSAATRGEQDRGQQDLIDAALFKHWIFRCTAKMEMYEGNASVKYRVKSIAPFDYVQESKSLINIIRSYG